MERDVNLVILVPHLSQAPAARIDPLGFLKYTTRTITRCALLQSDPIQVPVICWFPFNTNLTGFALDLDLDFLLRRTLFLLRGRTGFGTDFFLDGIILYSEKKKIEYNPDYI